MSHRASLALAAALAALPALAQERPDENALFGGDTPEQSPAPSSEARPDEDALFGDDSAEAPPEDRDARVLGGSPMRDAFESGAALDDPLKIGGRFYLRAFTQGSEGVSFGDTALSAPMLVDGYFDARPTERVRGFVLGRLTFDPTRAEGAGGFLSPTAGTGGLDAVASPRVLLDQAWLRFDLAHQVFITAGKQHVKWGTARFWNPTDVLLGQRRDPLALFDARTGATMVKVHVPWEAKGWNFYALGMLDNAGPANTLGKVGGAARAEVVLGQTEVGASAILQPGRKPLLGLDFSSALGPLDVYGELALRRGSDTPLFRLPRGVSLEELLTAGGGVPDLGQLPIEAWYPDGFNPQVSGGVQWTFAWSENDTATVGAEYFYNSLGYPTSLAYPYLLFQGQFQPFYIGQHYAALYALLMGPGSWDDTNFILSNLGNLSDRSFVTRLDVTHRALRYLSVEAFAAVNYGHKGGEFRLAMELPPMSSGGQLIPALSIPAPTFQLGVGLRIDL